MDEREWLEKWMEERFRLERDNGDWVGHLTPLAKQQIDAEAPMYAHQLAHPDLWEGKVWDKDPDTKPAHVVELTSPKHKRQAIALETKVFRGPTPDTANHKTFGIFEGGKLVAMTRVNTRPLDEWKKDSAYDKLKALAPEVWISSTAVDPDYRGRGYATGMKTHLQGKYSRIMTGTGPKSHASMPRINERLGFRPVLTRGKRGQNTQYFWSDDSKQGTGPSHIFITGLPGSGKTTLAKKKAKELGIPLISLDRLAAENKRYPGTSEARRYIRELDTPHVIEGTQLLGFRKEDFKGHRVLLLEESRGVIVDRLVRRGWNDSSGKLHKGEGERGRAVEFHDSLVGAVEDFKRKEIGSKTNWDKIKERDTPSHVVVTGHSGAGKSTLAKQLAEELGLPIHQLDKDPAFGAAKFPEKSEEYSPEQIAKLNRIRKDILVRALSKKDPHIIEGSQVLVDPKLTEKYRRILVDTPEKRIIRQRVRREYLKTHREPRWSKEEGREVARKLIRLHQDEIAAFRKSPGVEVSKPNTPVNAGWVSGYYRGDRYVKPYKRARRSITHE
jgi:adenylate kinase family enzyme